jgi:UDP-N-acetylmuramate--alanine ligase
MTALGQPSASRMSTPTPQAPAGASAAPFQTSPDAPLEVRGRSVYLVGIGGCGMSGLARMLRARGAIVSGSDRERQATTDALQAEGVAVGFDQQAGLLPEACDLVICSAAVKPDHPERRAAERRGVPVLTYAQALGRSMIGWTGVAIAGTHGKSTTTSMLSCVLSDAGLDPTAIVGATCRQLGGREGDRSTGFRLGAERIPRGPLAGAPGIVLAEACEFNRSFHNFRPRLAAITGVEADHLDIYGTLDAVVEAFRQFAHLVAPGEEGGSLLIAHDGAHRREVTAGVRAQVQTIGFSPDADWTVHHDQATRRSRLTGPGRGTAVEWITRLPGVHNAMNAATAAVLALRLGADPDQVSASLSAFRGVDRRTQFLGERPHRLGGVVRVYDDYAHHPTEVDATLRGLRQFEAPEARNARLICVFQPHQHSRTRHLLEEFAAAFSAADVVIVPHIYFVRDSEAERQLVSAADLVDRLRSRGVQAMHLYPFEAIVEALENLTRPGDVLAVLGAGPVYQVAHGYLRGSAGAGRTAP